MKGSGPAFVCNGKWGQKDAIEASSKKDTHSGNYTSHVGQVIKIKILMEKKHLLHQLQLANNLVWSSFELLLSVLK